MKNRLKLHRGLRAPLLGAAALLLAAGGCGKEPNHHQDTFLEFPHAMPLMARALQTQAAPAPWTSGRSIAVHGDELFVVDTENGDLVVLDRHALEVTRVIPVGERPEQVVVGPDGTAWVTVRFGGELVRVAPGSQQVAARAKVGTEPFGLALDAEAKTLFVTLSGEDRVVVADPATLATVQSQTTLERPRAIAVSPKGWITVAHQSDDALTFDLATSGLITDVSGARTLRRNVPSDLMTFTGVDGTKRATRAIAATVHPETGGALIAHITANPGDENDALSADRPETSAPSSGGYGSTSTTTANEFSVPSRPVELAVTALGGDGSIVPATGSLPVKDPASGEPMTHRVEQPSDINHHPTWTLAFVTGFGSDNVLVLNTAAADPMVAPLAEFKVGHAPKAIAFSADGLHAYVLNAHDYTVSELDLAPLMAMKPTEQVTPRQDTPFAMGAASDTFGPVTKPLNLAAARAKAFGVDPLPPAVRRGARVFTYARNERMSHAGSFACGTCHFEGTEDKIVWMIGDGPRQTPALAGRLADTAPYNWNGTKPELQGNMVQTVERMGGKGLTNKELEDLEQFMLHGLHAPPNPYQRPEGLNEQEEWGRQIFNRPDVGCGTCHSGVALTDGRNHDVGTATPAEIALWKQRKARGEEVEASPGLLNTPTLRGLHYTAPYLHTGAAETLHDVLEQTATTMGKTIHLTDDERDALVAYLLTL